MMKFIPRLKLISIATLAATALVLPGCARNSNPFSKTDEINQNLSIAIQLKVSFYPDEHLQ